MPKHDPFLTVRFEGEAVGEATIPVAHLLKFLSNFMKALERTGSILFGDPQSLPSGFQAPNIKDELSLELTRLTHGSPAAILELERSPRMSPVHDADPGLTIIETAIRGLGMAQSDEAALPRGCDASVLMAWRDAGVVIGRGIDRIEVNLNESSTARAATLTSHGLVRIRERIRGSRSNVRAIEGRLLMADFKEHGTRCRVHPSVGDPILCLFDREQRDEVLENMLRYVRVVGESKEDAVTGRIVSVRIHDIERLDEREGESIELLPQGTPVSWGFWDSPTLDDLAEAQGVQPIENIEILFGTWPGDPDDGFEESIHVLRHERMGREYNR